MNYIIATLVIVLFAFCNGCTTTRDTDGGTHRAMLIPLPGVYDYDISSTPAGADVFINGQLKGKSPLLWKRSVMMQSIETTTIEAKLPNGASGVVKGLNINQKPKVVEHAAVIYWGVPGVNIHFDLRPRPTSANAADQSATPPAVAEAAPILRIETDYVPDSSPDIVPVNCILKQWNGGIACMFRQSAESGLVFYIRPDIWVNNSLHTYIGNIRWVEGTLLSEAVKLRQYTFVSSPSNPLQFRVRTNEGKKGINYVYVSGGGKVIKPDKSEQIFP